MDVERFDTTTSLLDLLDRVLERGVVVDPVTRPWRAGIDLRSGARIVATTADEDASGAAGAGDCVAPR